MPSRRSGARSRKRARAAVEVPETPDHGEHTLRVWSGTVVGIDRGEVFVELGPRMQGVLALERFEQPPALGETFDFTVLGQEDGLWALARVEEKLLDAWSEMECGRWVQARVTGKNPGGLELRVGELHGFMPRSQTGLPRDRDPRVLVGTEILCEVIEVDVERQRVLLSRRNVERRQREGQLAVGAVKPGQVVQARVTRIEPYGAFVRFGQGHEGLIHVSDLSVERVQHPSEVVELGQSVEAKVLTIRRGGQRIGLGLKQMSESPWRALERTAYVDQVLEGEVTRVAEYGLFVRVARGVEGLLHVSEAGLGDGRRVAESFKPGERLAVRLLELDVEGERLALSRLHRDGRALRPEDALAAEDLERLEPEGEPPAATNLGALLARALRRRGG